MQSNIYTVIFMKGYPQLLVHCMTCYGMICSLVFLNPTHVYSRTRQTLSYGMFEKTVGEMYKGSKYRC